MRCKFFILLIASLLAVTGCKITSSPPAGPVSLEQGAAQEFSVSMPRMLQRLRSFQWYVNDSPLPEETGLSYVFQSSSPGTYTVTLRVTGKYRPADISFSWPVTVSGSTASLIQVPAASSCADIEKAGLACSTVPACSDSAAAGSVLSQSPAAGAAVQPGSAVTLTISSGPCPLLVPATDSCDDIIAAGLNCKILSICSATIDEGDLIRLDPAAGTQVQPGDNVTLIFSSGSCSVIVPEAASCADITAAGLLCHEYYTCNNTIDAGEIISQSPAAGAEIQYGDTVTLTISAGPCIPLAAPQNVHATDVDIDNETYNPLNNNNYDDRVIVTWDAVEHATYYEVYRSDSPADNYALIGTSTATTYSDNQSETLPTIDELDLLPATSAANINANEAKIRPIFNDFKNFKYYRVKACSTVPQYVPSDFSSSDLGRMDYTLDEFAEIATLMTSLPLMRGYIAIDPADITSGITQTQYDNCSATGNMHLAVNPVLHGVKLYGQTTLQITDYTDSLDYLASALLCDGGRQLISDGGIAGEILITVFPSLALNGVLQNGRIDFTGDFAGIFDNITIPFVDSNIVAGRCTVKYNGQESPQHAFAFE